MRGATSAAFLFSALAGAVTSGRHRNVTSTAFRLLRSRANIMVMHAGTWARSTPPVVHSLRTGDLAGQVGSFLRSDDDITIKHHWCAQFVPVAFDFPVAWRAFSGNASGPRGHVA